MSKPIAKTWVIIDRAAIASNCKILKKQLLPGTKFLAVIKADAYGHGAIEVAKTVVKAGADYLAVFDIEEAIALRKAKITSPILVLRSLRPDEIVSVQKYNLEVTVSTFDLLRYLKKTKLSKRLKIHLMVDTGLGRDGFLLEESERVIALLDQNKNIDVVGLATHFSASETRLHDAYTVMQVTCMFEWQRALREIGLNPMLHASATAGVFISKEFGMGMTRFGIGLYGLWPSRETELLSKGKQLRPALAWKTIVNEVKTLQAGSYVGYDLTARVMRDTTVAVLPVGYADGYPRSASNTGSVLIRGKRARILGRVMMNMMVVDVTDIKGVIIGDEVTLIGTSKASLMSAEEVAETAKTINYELVTRIDARVPRIYKK
jgi:alanine racemase